MEEKGNRSGSMGGEERGRSPSGATPIDSGLHSGTLPANGRWSNRRKQQVVLRMLRGEPLDALSRELGVEVYKLELWREKALTGMETALKERNGDPLNAELDRAKKTIGELTMEIELLRKRCEAKESLQRRRSR
ncbi:MAG: IS3 family transposase [Actinomycetia bacterium]|nr:IS3 family transposase [Actinomycetes bacterium]